MDALFEQAAHPIDEADARAWGFYGHRLALHRDTVPHPGFAILKRWGERMPNGYSVFTSNVDGQFQKAGYDKVHECHGSVHHLQCLEACTDDIWSTDAFMPEVDIDSGALEALEAISARVSAAE